MASPEQDQAIILNVQPRNGPTKAPSDDPKPTNPSLLGLQTIKETEIEQTETEMEPANDDEDEPSTANGAANRGLTLGSLGAHLFSYFDNTTVHGFKYILIGDTVAERAGWVTAVVLAFAGAFVLIDTYVDEVVNNPITMTLSKIPVSEVPFPAVTVDSGQVVDHFGYVRRALGRVPVDERDEGTEKGLNTLNMTRELPV